jgi:hypothetical protein
MATSSGYFTNLLLTQNPFVGFPKGMGGDFLSKAIDEKLSLTAFDKLNAPARMLEAMKSLPIIDEPATTKLIDSIYRDFPRAKMLAIEGNGEDTLETLCKCVTSDIQSKPTAIVFNPELYPYGARLKLVIEYESELGYFHWLFHVGDDRFIFLGHVEKIVSLRIPNQQNTGIDSYKEADNRGTRHDTESKANNYWNVRTRFSKKEPFLLYFFDTEKDAREALLKLPCIHVAKDTKNLICTEVLIFGYYQTSNGKYEAIICGNDLSHELWEIAKSSFIEHGGHPRGQGELEPDKNAQPARTEISETDKVVFVKEYQEYKSIQVNSQVSTVTLTYRMYRADNRSLAMLFLENNPVEKNYFYLVVQTPEGNYCRDINGFYKEEK